MSDESPATLRRIAEEGARLAGRLLAERFHGERTIEYKGGIDLVTDADRAAEAAVLGFIRQHYPHHAVLAEESGASQGSGIRWIVDPLDGTTNYAHQVPHFCVSVGVEGPDGLLAGAIYEPMLEELFSAARGQGATLNGRALKVSGCTEFSRALLCTGFPYDVHHKPEGPLGMLRRFIVRAQGMRRMGSAALDLAYVAAGRFDGYFEFGLKPWDEAAGALLVQEAGGVMLRIDGAPYQVGYGDVLACAPGLAPQFVAESKGLLADIGWSPRAFQP
ncbi:Inositol-1-monophosphatase [Cystobacter fuscus DSM 2262]|uniref:Inositol-1-monophosphatase n=1 Tax=Cystobacter fuscus (strain ATCC 25194 / DSM 2262 / NBRC 100088 / M29) TaxID=1242864 RepID=S9PFL8_CYSF2|nr:inositol monophosphatase family protein [Cystobacter fuscus]EPX61876.1 Inositol-1-monophosphatase [Cystobacter fuscus DSM 2262]